MNKTRHRRLNSYSYTANSQLTQAYEEFEEKLLKTTSNSEVFDRSTEARRSYRSTVDTSKARHQGYKNVVVKQTLPANIKFSTTNSEESEDMSRPRSPSKTSRMEVKNITDYSEPALDSVLAAIREQLVSCCTGLHLSLIFKKNTVQTKSYWFLSFSGSIKERSQQYH